MGASQPRLSIQGATDEILRRQAAGTRYGQLYAPPPDDIAALRRQQAAFADTRAELDRRNSWMSIPAFAPALAVLGLEGAAMLGARFAGMGATRAPFVLPEPPPPARGGHNLRTRVGQERHQALREQVRLKDGWDSEPTLMTKNGIRRPDVLAPERSSGKRFQMELKPDTPSGRAAAARAVKRYFRDTKNKTRAIFYDPEDFM